MSLCRAAFAALLLVGATFATPSQAQTATPNDAPPTAGAPAARGPAPTAAAPDPAAPVPGPASTPGGQAAADTPVSPPAQPLPSAAAPGTGPTPAEAARPISPHGKMGDLSPWSMFMEADILVKAVMIGLAFASVLTWTIFLGKTAELFLAQRRLVRSLKLIDSSGSLLEAQMRMGKQRDVASVLVQQAVLETRLSADIPGEVGLRERVASRFGEVQRAEGRIIRRGMGLLATMGSTSPFVGLFGTVWGIMNSFIGISKSQTTNLAVVAPGIAEALLATAIGLVAAIPAVIVYNHFSRATKGYMEGVSRAAGAVGRLLSRDLDRARGRPLAQAAE